MPFLDITNLDGLLIFAVILFVVIMALVGPWYIRSGERRTSGWRGLDVLEQFLEFFKFFR